MRVRSVTPGYTLRPSPSQPLIVASCSARPRPPPTAGGAARARDEGDAPLDAHADEPHAARTCDRSNHTGGADASVGAPRRGHHHAYLGGANGRRWPLTSLGDVRKGEVEGCD